VQSQEGVEAVCGDEEEGEVHDERIAGSVVPFIFPRGDLGDAIESILCTEILRVQKESEVSEVQIGERQEPLRGAVQEGEGIFRTTNKLRLVQIEGRVRRGGGKGGGGGEGGRGRQGWDECPEWSWEEWEQHGDGVLAKEEKWRGWARSGDVVTTRSDEERADWMREDRAEDEKILRRGDEEFSKEEIEDERGDADEDPEAMEKKWKGFDPRSSRRRREVVGDGDQEGGSDGDGNESDGSFFVEDRDDEREEKPSHHEEMVEEGAGRASGGGRRCWKGEECGCWWNWWEVAEVSKAKEDGGERFSDIDHSSNTLDMNRMRGKEKCRQKDNIHVSKNLIRAEGREGGWGTRRPEGPWNRGWLYSLHDSQWMLFGWHWHLNRRNS
jgi:hypothetical protein